MGRGGSSELSCLYARDGQFTLNRTFIKLDENFSLKIKLFGYKIDYLFVNFGEKSVFSGTSA